MDSWTRCTVPPHQLPPREVVGRAFWVLIRRKPDDFPRSAYGSENNRVGDFPRRFAGGYPNLSLDRGTADGCGSLYSQAVDRGELVTFAGRLVPLKDFLGSVVNGLVGVEIMGGCSDRYRRAETLQLIEDEDAGIDFDWQFVPMGCGERGSFDVRAFQNMVLRGELRTAPNLLFASGLSSAIIRRDGNSNPGLDRSGKARIDLISAAVLAAGLKSAADGDDSGFGVSQVSV